MQRRFADLLAVAVVIVALTIAATYSAAAEPTPPVQPAPDGVAIVDGTHLAALSDVTLQLQERQPASGRPQLQQPKPLPPLGSNVKFWSWDFATGSFYQVHTTFQRLSEHTELYVQTGYPIADTTLDDIVHVADSVMVAREHKAFGVEPDPGIDGVSRLVIVLLDIRDAQYYGMGGSLVGGYFWALNEYLQSTIDEWYPDANFKSNEREMLFVDDLATVPNSREFYQVMTHEFQHMIHWNYDPDEEGWVNEGMSNLAAQLTGYGLPSSHVQAFLNNPNKNLTTGSSDPLADYGGYGLFSLFMWEQYGGDAASNAIVQMPENGSTGLNLVLAQRGFRDDFADVVSHWAVANYVDDLSVYGYRNIDIVAGGADGQTSFSRPPVTVRAAYPTSLLTTTVAAWGADYILFDDLAQGDLVITLTAGTNADFTVNIVTSPATDFAAGTNTLREVSLPRGRTASVTVRGAGSAVNRVLLIPVHTSQSADRGTLTYQATMVERTTPVPPTVTPAATATPSRTATATRTATTMPTASRTPTATATTPVATASPTATATHTRTTTSTPSPTATSTVVPPSNVTDSYTKRFDSGGQGYTDHQGDMWAADTAYTPGGAGYVGGQTYVVSSAVSGTADAPLYQSERWGMTAYRFDVPNGTYSVTLKFAEIYASQPGLRVFDVRIDGQTVLANFDVYRAARGKNRAYDRTFVAVVTDQQLVVSFIGRTSEAAIKGIAVQSVVP